MTKTIAKPDDDLGRLGLIELAGEWSRRMRSPRVRSLCQFSEEEIIVPTGPYRDRPFKLARHPAPRLLFPEIDSGRWRRVIVTGPNQDGKSLIGFVIWALWVLFELRETLILGAPSIDLVSDKWRDDLLPVIKASRYRTLLPTSGKGSRDGDAVRFDFKNGVDLRFMTGGGRDYARAGKASQYLAITEMEGFDVVGGASREGTKFDQLQRRTLAFGDDARIVGESTVGTEAGRTWQEYQAGTQSRIALPCPHCGAFVTPEREHLKGWQEAATDAEARRSCFIACPECGAAWTNDERLDANDRAVLVHKGQSVEPDGTITGDVPDTDTLSFRWTCVNSTLRPERMSMVGGLEWAALRSDKSDEAERDIRQSQWALPAKPKVKDLSGLDVAKIAQRVIPGLGRGICPAETRFVTVACDIGKYVCHWTAIAWRDGATPHICDYGVLEVNPQEMGEERGILIALRQFRDGRLAEGFMLSDRTRQEHTEEGEAGPAKDEPRIYPTMRAFDAGNWQDTVLAFAAESGTGTSALRDTASGSGTGGESPGRPGVAYSGPSTDTPRSSFPMVAVTWKSTRIAGRPGCMPA